VILALVVGLAAGLGAVVRYTVDQAVSLRHDGALPYGTLTVNLSGSLVLGLVTGVATHHGLPADAAVILSAGFCSGYTTWSTFSYETLALVESGAVLAAVANVVLSVAAGLAAAAAGLGLALL